MRLSLSSSSRPHAFSTFAHTHTLFLTCSEPVREAAPAVGPRRPRLAVFSAAVAPAALVAAARARRPSHLLLLLGLEGHVRAVAAHGSDVVLVVAEHAALLVVGGHLDVVAALGAAAGAAPPEEDVDAVPRLGAEGEVDERVEERRRVHRPLHHGLVALGVEAGDEAGGEALEGQEAGLDLPVRHDVVEVEEFVGCARGLVEEDEEEGDDGEPELGGAQLAGAAAEHLHQQRPPRDEEQDHRQHEGQQRREDVVEVADGLQVLAVFAPDVHAHLKKRESERSFD